MTIRGELKAGARRLGITRKRVASTRMRMERRIPPRVPRAARPAGPRILAYHGVGTPDWGINDCAPATFRRHLEVAVELGYSFVPAAAIAEGRAPGASLAITFDDGLASVVKNAAPVLAEFGAPWTVFVTSKYADHEDCPWARGTAATWAELDRVSEYGGSVGSHATTHRNFATLTRAEVTFELTSSRDRIRRELGFTPTEFAIPFGRARDWSRFAQDEARTAGYDRVYAYTMDRRFPGTVGRTAVTAFDGEREFRALLNGVFDGWEEWI